MIYCLSHNSKTTLGYTGHLKMSFFFDWSAQWWQDHESYPKSVYSFSSPCVKT